MEAVAQKPNMEEYAIVLDFLPYGKSTDARREPVAQAVGELHFTLLEVVPKPTSPLAVGERIYIGKGERERIDHIKGRISFSELTGGAKSELEPAIRKVIDSREADFVRFFNKSGPITIRLHQLELLPGVGKKHMLDIMKERERKQFESLKEVSERVKLLPDPRKLLTERILEELKGGSKYYIMTRPPYQPRPY
jgi:putative nucleotide binding protein